MIEQIQKIENIRHRASAQVCLRVLGLWVVVSLKLVI